jgi:cell division septum initiation protein DivIVA
MTDPSTNPRFPTDPVEPTVPAGYGSVPPVPTDDRDPAHLDDSPQRTTGPEDTVLGGTRFEEEPSIDELAPEVSTSDDVTSASGVPSGYADDGDRGGSGGGASGQAKQAASTAKDEAASLAGTARDEGSDLASTAANAAGSVVDAEKAMARDTVDEATDRAQETVAEAKAQIKDLWAQSRHELNEGASVQLQRLSLGARTISEELDTMASASDDPGIASSLARRASGYLSTAGEWLEDRGPDEVFAEVARYARRSPGTFLAIAAGLGLVAGRVARSLKDDSSSGESTGTSTGTSAASTGTGAYGTPSSSADGTTGTSAYGTAGTPDGGTTALGGDELGADGEYGTEGG